MSWSPSPFVAIAVSGTFVVVGAHYLAPVIVTLLGHRSYWGRYDYRTFYAAGRLVLDGRGSELYDIGAVHSVIATAPDYYNPPVFALVMAPFATLSFGLSFDVWSLLSIAALALSAYLIWGIARPAGTGAAVCAVVGLAMSAPVLHGLVLGQFSFLLLCAWTSGFVLLQRGSERAAGCVLATLMIKPELHVITALMLLAWKRRAVPALALTTAAGVAVSLAVAGPRSLYAYPAHLLHTARIQNTVEMYGWSGSVRLLPVGGTTAVVIAALLSLATVAMVACALRWGASDERASVSRGWLLITSAVLVPDAHLFLQDLMLLAPAFAAAYAASDGRRRWAIGVCGVCTWIVLWAPPYGAATLLVPAVLAVALLVRSASVHRAAPIVRRELAQAA